MRMAGRRVAFRLATAKLIGKDFAMVRKTVAILSVVVALAGGSAHAAPAAEGSYEAGLLRLSEVLGSLHFLRTLCGDKSDVWRLEMEKLLAAEKPTPERRAKLVATFNRGYRAFERGYTRCTASASEAMRRYRLEGEALSRDIAARYGN